MTLSISTELGSETPHPAIDPHASHLSTGIVSTAAAGSPASTRGAIIPLVAILLPPAHVRVPWRSCPF